MDGTYLGLTNISEDVVVKGRSYTDDLLVAVLFVMSRGNTAVCGELILSLKLAGSQSQSFR